MAKSSIKIRAKVKKEGEAKVKCLISHPMETGLRKDKKSGKLIPAHFIQEVNCEHGGKTVLNAQWNGTISKNPFLSFAFTGVKFGDTLKISWVDNTGKSDSTTAWTNKWKTIKDEEGKMVKVEKSKDSKSFSFTQKKEDAFIK